MSAPESVKHLRRVQRTGDRHWVGDGFPVRTLFSYGSLGSEISPFLLLDHAGPVEFPPTEQRLGVGEHPHRGFETVTIVYAGEVEHRDSAGGGGRIGPGDVQWMTAAAGVVHEEFHGRDFARRGGLFEMAQLWVNLPARHKLSPPRYQAILADRIPSLELGAGKARLRVIAGEHQGARGPALTFTPVDLLDLRLEGGAELELALREGHTTLFAMLAGELLVEGESLSDGEVGHFERSGSRVRLRSEQGAKLLILGGQPIDEPIAGHGPFVMNTEDQIHQAILDFQAGRLGSLR